MIGVDTSERSLEVARAEHGSERVQFARPDQIEGDGTFDLVFCNGVFHHIPPEERPASFEIIRRSLRPGGVFAFWENNPWNPGTRYVMSRIPFDRDAATITPPKARRLLHTSGFEVLHTDFLFIFPKLLSPLRILETLVAWAPLGAPYLVLCCKPRNEIELRGDEDSRKD